MQAMLIFSCFYSDISVYFAVCCLLVPRVS